LQAPTLSKLLFAVIVFCLRIPTAFWLHRKILGFLGCGYRLFSGCGYHLEYAFINHELVLWDLFVGFIRFALCWFEIWFSEETSQVFRFTTFSHTGKLKIMFSGSMCCGWGECLYEIYL